MPSLAKSPLAPVLGKYLPVRGPARLLFSSYARTTHQPRQSLRSAVTEAGDVFQADLSSTLEWQLWAFGRYEPHFAELFALLVRPGDRCVDVGANVGVHAVRLARLTGPKGEVVAIEPDPGLLRRAECNVLLNDLGNVRLVNAAASDRPGQLSLYRPDPADTNRARASLLRHSYLTGDSITVPVVTVDSVCGDVRVALIKIDVEGHEAAVLRGAARTIDRHAPAVIFEHDPELLGEDEQWWPFGWLADRGYVMFAVHAARQPVSGRVRLALERVTECSPVCANYLAVSPQTADRISSRAYLAGTVSTTFAAALLANAASIVLLRHRLGRRWLRHPTTLLMLTSCVVLAIAPLLLRIPSVAATNTYAIGVNQGYTDFADFVMSIAMLAFTAGYLLMRPELAVIKPRQVDRAAMAKILDWRILAAACVPLVIITSTGQGYNDGTVTASDVSLTTNIVTTFFIIVIAMASVGFLLRFGSRWFLPVLVLQSVLLAVAGERTPILMDALALVLVLRFVGMRLSRRQLAVAAMLAVAGVFAITGVRSQQGRSIFYVNNGVSSRVTALGEGLLGGSATTDEPAGPGLVAQFALREAGVNFAGAILQSISDGQPRLSARYVPESLLLAVPGFLWSNKLDLGTGLDPAQQQINNFGLQNINFIPGLVGEYTGYLTPPWLVILFGALGFVFGRFERWLLRRSTPARAILLAGAVVSALLYEAGLPAVLVQMRAAATLAIVAKCAEMAVSRRSSGRHFPRLAQAHGGAAVSRRHYGGVR